MICLAAASQVFSRWSVTCVIFSDVSWQWGSWWCRLERTWRSRCQTMRWSSTLLWSRLPQQVKEKHLSSHWRLRCIPAAKNLFFWKPESNYTCSKMFLFNYLFKIRNQIPESSFRFLESEEYETRTSLDQFRLQCFYLQLMLIFASSWLDNDWSAWDLFSTGTNYAFDWRLITHPKDYSGEMEGQKSATLKLSKVQISGLCWIVNTESSGCLTSYLCLLWASWLWACMSSAWQWMVRAPTERLTSTSLSNQVSVGSFPEITRNNNPASVMIRFLWV